MSELKRIQAHFEELNELLRADPEMPHAEAMLIIDAMRVCVDEKDALKEAEYIANENNRQRAILVEVISEVLHDSDMVFSDDVEALTEKLVDAFATSGDGYES